MTTENTSAQTLRAYLLGQLAEPESERLDELSITDQDVADRIRAAEYDLVDAYARGELHGVDLERFRSIYLATPRGRDAVRFAEALQSVAGSGASDPSLAGPREAALAGGKRRQREWLAVVAALVALATVSVWLAVENRTLRARATSAESARDELQRDRQQQASAARPPVDSVATTPEARPSTNAVATLVLAPQLRSARQATTVALTDGSQELPVQVDLEPADYPSYVASLVAASGEQVLWRADGLIARTTGARRFLDLRLTAEILSPQDYLIRVSGVPTGGTSEIVGEYRFTVVR